VYPVAFLSAADNDLATISTDGINIDKWPLNVVVDGEDGKPKKQEIELSVWDFAGQGMNFLWFAYQAEIYYATHQFFMSKRSIYLLVWNLANEPGSRW
jgi:hypothetical protein